ncbi:hypothetical protein GCM10009535_47220 [Streptomyces thermocarboxydovorans]|uniref:Lipoprotein n=1 Tax=Streptomyces thermocarboxydovorans TaxID=59298 RepID=A0ABN1HPT9_9ACTN
MYSTVKRNGGFRARTLLAPLCAALTMSTVVLAGCGGPADRPPAGKGTAAAAARAGEARDLTDAERITVERAEEILVARCMRERGFRYWPGPVAGLADRQGHGYVLTDVAWAKRYGYGRELEERARRARLEDRNTAYTERLSRRDLARYNKALDGTLEKDPLKVELPRGGTVWMPRDGCRARAMAELYGDLPTWFRVKKTVQSLTALYAPDILADPRFKRAVGAWSACMRKAGHPYATPREIREQRPRITRGMSPKEARAAEVRLAVAEATCADRTPLARTARSLEKRLREEKLRPYRDDIATFRRMSLTALFRARALEADAATP